MFVQPVFPGINDPSKPTRKTGRKRHIATVALSSLLSVNLIFFGGCKGQSFDIGPSTGEVVGVIVGAGAVVGVTTAVLIHVHHSHHQVKGCVNSGPNGFEVQTEDKKTWLLTGNTAGIAAGNLIKFHGTKMKQPKHSAGEPTFEVEAIRKNYGQCKATAPLKAELAEPDPFGRAR